jgi:hypothetical protein
MRKAFQHYFKPTPAQLAKLWNDGLLSFDASVLLNVYGYSKETAEELLTLAENNAERVRLPHQFALEYARNRAAAIIKQVHNYLGCEKQLDEIKDKYLAPRRDHPYLSKRSLRAYEKILEELAANRAKIEKYISADPYLERILGIFDGRVGGEPTAEELAHLQTEAQERFKNKVPPGYADAGKPNGGGAGDYVAWHQLMAIAKTEKKGIILVIDDFKEDWWQMEKERTIGPRPELLIEFSRITQQWVYLYTSESFLRAAKEFGADIKDTVIKEVGERLQRQREEVRAVLPDRFGQTINVSPSDKAFTPEIFAPLTSGARVFDTAQISPDFFKHLADFNKIDLSQWAVKATGFDPNAIGTVKLNLFNPAFASGVLSGSLESPAEPTGDVDESGAVDARTSEQKLESAIEEKSENADGGAEGDARAGGESGESED